MTMMQVEDYFDKPVIDWDLSIKNLSADFLFHQIIAGKPLDGDWSLVDLAILGIADGCNSPGNEQCALAPDAIRKELYQLAGFENLRVVDLGNVKGVDVRNRICALNEVLPTLLDAGVVVLVLGGSQDYLHPLARIVGNREKLTLAIADSRIDWESSGDDYTADGFIKCMADDLSDCLSQCFLLGTQRYFIPGRIENSLDHNIFENIRLANIRGELIKQTEPVLRESNVFGLDVSVVRSVDMPAQKRAMPNGIMGHELCQIARYAGLSDRMQLGGFFELNPLCDSPDKRGVALMAQAVWHFIEGVGHRYFDYPFCPLDHYDTFVVWMDDFELEITFFRNSLNNRWWVKIPSGEGETVMACSEEDYKKASGNEFPDRWFKAMLKRN